MLVSKKHDKMKGQCYSLSTLLLVIGLLLPFGTLADSQNTQSSSSASGRYQVPAYERKPGVAGKISSVGSDTLANLMTFWSQEFKTLYPQVGFQIQASGSSTAPPALIEGTATLGPMRRELKPSEILTYVFSIEFFVNDLALKNDQVTGFLEYIDKNLPSQKLLKTGQQFQLIDYLISESQNYRDKLNAK